MFVICGGATFTVSLTLEYLGFYAFPNIQNTFSDSFMYGPRQMHQNVTQDKGMQQGGSEDRNTGEEMSGNYGTGHGSNHHGRNSGHGRNFHFPASSRAFLLSTIGVQVQLRFYFETNPQHSDGH